MRAVNVGPILALFLLLIFSLRVSGVVRVVPADYPTIQSALDSLDEGDTVLVDIGIYAEALFAPQVSFTLKGNVVPDTGDFPRPIINPSSLDNSSSLTCLTIGIAAIVVEDFVFQNGPEMYPHTPIFSPGGVRNQAAGSVFRRCLFDSTSYGLRTSEAVILEQCVFRNTQYRCIGQSYPQIEATDCSFDLHNGNWASVEAGSNSIFLRCTFTQDNTEDVHVLLAASANIIVEDCIFGPTGPTVSQPLYLHLSDARFERNLFTNCAVGSSVIHLNCDCGDPVIFRNNVFDACGTPLNWPLNNGACMGVYTGDSTCATVEIEQNIFMNCRASQGTAGISVAGFGNSVINRNRITSLRSNLHPAIYDEAGGESVISDNLIYENDFGAGNQSGNSIDARFNWWGDSTGPRAVTNPNGLGDSVGANVLYDPWHMDTLFFSDTPEHPHPLPEVAVLDVYPNPFNPAATLKLTVPRAMIVRVEIFDILGRSIQDIFSGPVAIEREIHFNASSLSSGLYFARAYDTIGNRPVAMAKLLLLK